MDRRILLCSAFLRSLATGMFAVLVGYYLAALGLGPSALGGVVAAGLAGLTLATLWAGASHARRRRALLVVAGLSVVGAVAMASADSLLVLTLGGLVGMVAGHGRDRGAATIMEQALLPATTDDAGRTRAFASYNALSDMGGALGSLLAGLPQLLQARGMQPLPSFRAAMLVYASLMAASGVLYLFLSRDVDGAPGPRPKITPETRSRLVRLSALFAIDSLGGGFIPSAIVAYWFFQRFGMEAGAAGALFFGARFLNAISHFGAAWLAKRIGLVNTMVFTHIPASLLLVTVTIAPSLWIAVVLFLLREGLSSMDVPTRQSFVMAVVRPEERMVASAATNLARNAGSALTPALAGMAMSTALAAPLYAGAAIKIAYDLVLWRSFRSLRPPEEATSPLAAPREEPPSARTAAPRSP